MTNDASKAEFWKDFICARSEYPAPEKLRAHFAKGHLSDFCQCGCNSFGLVFETPELVDPIIRPGTGGPFFELSFWLEEKISSGSDERQFLTISFFADEDGRLSHVDIDCCVNSYPVPPKADIVEPPFQVSISDAILLPSPS